MRPPFPYIERERGKCLTNKVQRWLLENSQIDIPTDEDGCSYTTINTLEKAAAKIIDQNITVPFELVNAFQESIRDRRHVTEWCRHHRSWDAQGNAQHTHFNAKWTKLFQKLCPKTIMCNAPRPATPPVETIETIYEPLRGLHLDGKEIDVENLLQQTATDEGIIEKDPEESLQLRDDPLEMWSLILKPVMALLKIRSKVQEFWRNVPEKTTSPLHAARITSAAVVALSRSLAELRSRTAPLCYDTQSAIECLFDTFEALSVETDADLPPLGLSLARKTLLSLHDQASHGIVPNPRKRLLQKYLKQLPNEDAYCSLLHQIVREIYESRKDQDQVETCLLHHSICKLLAHEKDSVDFLWFLDVATVALAFLVDTSWCVWNREGNFDVGIETEAAQINNFLSPVFTTSKFGERQQNTNRKEAFGVYKEHLEMAYKLSARNMLPNASISQRAPWAAAIRIMDLREMAMGDNLMFLEIDHYFAATLQAYNMTRIMGVLKPIPVLDVLCSVFKREVFRSDSLPTTHLAKNCISCLGYCLHEGNLKELRSIKERFRLEKHLLWEYQTWGPNIQSLEFQGAILKAACPEHLNKAGLKRRAVQTHTFGEGFFLAAEVALRNIEDEDFSVANLNILVLSGICIDFWAAYAQEQKPRSHIKALDGKIMFLDLMIRHYDRYNDPRTVSGRALEDMWYLGDAFEKCWRSINFEDIMFGVR